jgi:16S rRNA (adenine(1408)-N(1))-methyltransferase
MTTWRMVDNPFMRLLDGKQVVSLDPQRLAQLRERSSHVVVDVGTGDARTAYRLAKTNPGWLVIGIDPNASGMVDTAVRSKRKPARGGVGNLLLISAAIEAVPPELTGVADEVLVLMPWGKLLRGVVLGEPEVCAGLHRVAKKSATVDVTVGTSIWRPPVPLEIRDLPELTTQYVLDKLAPAWADSGLRVVEAQTVTGAEADRLPSSWARRLNTTDQEVVMHIRAVAD